MDSPNIRINAETFLADVAMLKVIAERTQSDLRALAIKMETIQQRVDNLEAEQLRKASVTRFLTKVVVAGWPIFASFGTAAYILFCEYREHILKVLSHA